MPSKPIVKRSAGRPAYLKAGGRVSLYLDAETVERARKLGDGNLSAGIRRAISQVKPSP